MVREKEEEEHNQLPDARQLETAFPPQKDRRWPSRDYNGKCSLHNMTGRERERG